MPEGGVAIYHDRLAVQVAHALDRIIIRGDDDLFHHVIQRHRKRYFLEALRVDRQVGDDDVALAGDQRRHQLGEIIHQHQLRLQPVR